MREKPGSIFPTHLV